VNHVRISKSYITKAISISTNLVLYNTYNLMNEKDNNSKLSAKQSSNEKEKNSQAYPIYPESEDIYNKYKEEKEINPEDITKFKESNDNSAKSNEKDFANDKFGSDLDIPGAELDDEQEEIGNEDEENNYYSLGGDDHNDLDESNGGL